MILRKAKYSDIVILLRSMKTNAEVIQKELMNAGIPAFANNQKGYFDTVEIRTLLSLLSVVDNIYMDIDLAAVLRSPNDRDGRGRTRTIKGRWRKRFSL